MELVYAATRIPIPIRLCTGISMELSIIVRSRIANIKVPTAIDYKARRARRIVNVKRRTVNIELPTISSPVSTAINL